MNERNDMKRWIWCAIPVATGIVTMIALAMCETSCTISPQKKGTLTMADNGAKYLTEKGDPLSETGIYAKKNVSPEYAAGYERGLSDAAKRDYWSMAEAQRWVHLWSISRGSRAGIK